MKQQLFHSAPRALSLGWIAFHYFGVSDIALYVFEHIDMLSIGIQ